MPTLPPPVLNGTVRNYPIQMLFERTAGDHTDGSPGRRLLSQALPPWQRPEVWTVQQKRRFIEGIFLGFGTGTYVINGSDYAHDGTPLPGSGWLLDGQQRLSALRDFVENGLAIFDGVTWASLSRGHQLMRFMNVVFPCHELAYTADEALLIDIYDRLNFGGTPHSADQHPISLLDGAP